jgi:adenosylcobinamide kinase/adenosylcobinamide-phosphate guanylyltransferase
VISLVLGGARSGKSELAEKLVSRLAGSAAVTYLATGVVTDEEMEARIRLHRERRPAGWGLVEATGDALPDALRHLDGAVLLDSLGTWVASVPDFSDREATRLCAALVERGGDTVVVSEEVGLGVHPSSEAGRRFRDDLGRLNTMVAELADDAVLVVAGRVLPLQPTP